MSEAGVLVVFAKAPRPGEVKTRMCPPLTPEQAADFYAAMLDDVLEATAEFAPRLGLAPVLAVHPAQVGFDHARGEYSRVILKNGRSLDLDGGSNDMGATITVQDESLGEVKLKWRDIDRLRFAH